MTHVTRLLAALALVGCDTPTAPAARDAPPPRRAVIQHERTDDVVFLTGIVGCFGDVLQGSGRFHRVVGSTVDAAGGQHLSIKEQYTNVRLTGTPSGATYVAHSQYTVNVTLHAGYTEVVNQTIALIGQGTTPNALLRFRFRIVIDAKGEVRTERDSYTVDCH